MDTSRATVWYDWYLEEANRNCYTWQLSWAASELHWHSKAESYLGSFVSIIAVASRISAWHGPANALLLLIIIIE